MWEFRRPWQSCTHHSAKIQAKHIQNQRNMFSHVTNKATSVLQDNRNVVNYSNYVTSDEHKKRMKILPVRVLLVIVVMNMTRTNPRFSTVPLTGPKDNFIFTVTYRNTYAFCVCTFYNLMRVCRNVCRSRGTSGSTTRTGLADNTWQTITVSGIPIKLPNCHQ